jgi:hypothetical protein
MEWATDLRYQAVALGATDYDIDLCVSVASGLAKRSVFNNRAVWLASLVLTVDRLKDGVAVIPQDDEVESWAISLLLYILEPPFPNNLVVDWIDIARELWKQTTGF